MQEGPQIYKNVFLFHEHQGQEKGKETEPYRENSKDFSKIPAQGHTCVVEKQGKAVDPCLFQMFFIPVRKIICQGRNELSQVVGGKYGGAGITFYAGKGAPLEGHDEKHGIEGHKRVHLRREKPQNSNHGNLSQNTDQPDVHGYKTGNKGGRNDGGNKDKKGTESQKQAGPIACGQVHNGMDHVGGLGGAENFAPVKKGVGAHEAA